ncbi:MAG: hypothetical protein P1V34_13360 [Alphaproteobacteria bacterium]|nr:hypothetical protein [Alphaproteobacteria bacterium]
MISPMDTKRRKPNLWGVATAFILPISLGACGSDLLTPFGVAAVTTAVIINEDKTPSDLLASAITGQDCDTIRKNRDKGPLCRAPREEVIEAPVFCYRTLGNVNCFSEPDPYGYDQQEIN